MAIVDDILACSITEIAPSGGGLTLGAVNELALYLDEAQYRARTGPCVQAAVQRCAQQVDVMSKDERFPRFAKVAVARGVHSLLSLPLGGGALPTALTLYAGKPGVFRSPRTQAVADLLARCTSALLRDAGTTPNIHDDAAASAYARGELVRRAQQALAEQRGLAREEAYTELVDCSRQLNRSILTVAAEVLQQTGQQHSDAAGNHGLS